MPKTAYMITVDGYLDQVCETLTTAQAEQSDLRRMGLNAIIRSCPWSDQDVFIERELK